MSRLGTEQMLVIEGLKEFGGKNAYPARKKAGAESTVDLGEVGHIPHHLGR